MGDKQRPGGSNFDWVDPERTEPANAFDDEQGLSGLGCAPKSEAAEGAKMPSGSVNGQAAAPSNNDDGDMIPAENGRRASFDSRTGEVHGSGVGAGGGQPGEDFDSDPQSGDGYPQTGSDGTAHADRDLGPPHFKE